MYALNLDENNRILSVTFDEYAPKNQPRVDSIPDGNVHDYLYIDEDFIHSPLPIEDVGEAPTQLDVIEAQVLYTAMMTDTLLEV